MSDLDREVFVRFIGHLVGQNPPREFHRLEAVPSCHFVETWGSLEITVHKEQ